MDEEQNESFIVKSTRGERIKRSIAARRRRKNVKKIATLHEYKEERESRKRLRAKQKVKKSKNNS